MIIEFWIIRVQASYSIDLPNGGNATITGNLIQQGPQSQNSNIIAYGEEGSLHAGTSLTVAHNTVINDLGRGPVLWNATSGNSVATFSSNTVYGFGGTPLVNGAANQSGTTVLSMEPTLNENAPYSVGGLILNVSEDAWNGDAQFTVSVDGTQIGGVRTATAAHAAGQSQQVALGPLTAGLHQVGLSFLNYATGGSSTTSRDLYLNSASYNGATVSKGAALTSNSTATFSVTVPAAATAPVSNMTVNVSEDAWRGNAQFTVKVDGQQLGGIFTATALHSAGQSQAFSFAGITETLHPHDIAISFINDAWGGTAATDRNLYVNSIQFDGATIAGSVNKPMYTTSTRDFTASAPAHWLG